MGSVQMMFDEIGLDDWEVKPSKKWISAARHTRKVTICKDRFFSELDIKRLAVHEVGVHAIRYTNGDHQPLKIFHFGFPESLSTEEGLAVYFEVATGNMNPMYFRNYAGRVLAIDCLRRNLDFRDCFSELQHYGFNDEDSWNLAVRVYRGGGFVKDHVYLQGYYMIDDFVKHGGDLRKLFVGKIGIEDLPLIDQLLQEKKIVEPRYMPPFLR